MKIPREFERQLLLHIVEEVRNPEGPRNGAALGQSAESFARRWFGLDDPFSDFQWSEGRELLAWSARLGKHVGEFLLNNKEG